MIGTIRKHSKVLWWVVIVAIIITFVWWGSNTSRYDGQGGAGNYGVMNGKVISPAVFEDARREVRLYHFFATGNFPGGGGRAIPNFDVERETFNRLLVVQKAEEMGIHASDEAVAKTATERLRMINNGNPLPLEAFEKDILARDRQTLADFHRFIRNELGIQQLITIAGVGGELATAEEIEALYRRDFQETSAQVVFFTATNHLQSVATSAEQLGQFYTNQLARYRVPELAQVSYIRIPISNFVAETERYFAQITNLNELIEARYIELGTNYFSTDTTPAAAHQQIRDNFFRSQLLGAAKAAAEKFDNLLYDRNPSTPEAFAALAQEQGFTAEVTAPFNREEAPAGLDVGPEFSRQAFALTSEDRFTTPIAGEAHVYVIAHNRRIPSSNPPFESVKDRVQQDYRYVEAAMAARRQAMEFHAAATGTNGLSAGKTFAALCNDASVKPITVSPFALSTRNIPELEGRVEQTEFKRTAFAAKPGEVGQLLPSADGAALVYVTARLPLDEATMRTNLPAFTRSVQQVRRSEVFNEWFRAEATKAFRTIPYFQQQQAQMSGAAAQP